VQTLLQDLRYASRQLWAQWPFTLLVVLTVSLGIGANTAVFSLVNGFHRPLPVHDPDRIVVLAGQTKGDETGFRYRLSLLQIIDLRHQATQFSDVFGADINQGGMSISGHAYPFLYSYVTGNFFNGLRVAPALGRLFQPGEGEHPGSEPLLVLSYSFWQKHLGGRPDIVGQLIRLDGFDTRVIGVTPLEFHGVYEGLDPEGYAPLSNLNRKELFTDRDRRALTTFARLKPGISIREAQSAMEVLGSRFEQQYPATDKGITFHVIPEVEARPVPLSSVAQSFPLIRGFVMLLAAVVLALACMNVANLLLVRATIRQRELAIRAALGSGRARLIRQALTESLLLAALGAAGGLIVGKWWSDGFAGSIDLATDLPTLLDFSFDWRVFSYALAASVVTGLLIGIWPALRASRTDAGAALHDGSRGDTGGPGRQRVRSLLVIGQVAGSLVLLIVAGLFMRSLQQAQYLRLGFEPDHLLNVRMDPEWAGYDEQRTKDFYRELERRVSALPGVQSATLAFSVPMGYYNSGRSVFVEGRPVSPDSQPPTIGCNMVDAPYFDTLQTRILRGRAFTESDDEHAPRVIILNQTMAARYWPGEDAIGKRLRISTQDSAPWEVVGIAEDGKYLSVSEKPLPYFYVPMAQSPISMRVLQVRSLGSPEDMSARVEREIRLIDREVPIMDLQTMRRSLNGLGGFMLLRLGARQAAAMGVLGLILAIVGVYGVVSYGAAQRTREIGVRMAMGARPMDVLRLVLRQGVKLVGGGVVLGLILSLVLVRVLRGMVVIGNVIDFDPVAFIGVTLLLTAIALGACYIPARRAMKVDPMVALRHE
jgi:macrolide transport system ATP-binding/permease protein